MASNLSWLDGRIRAWDGGPARGSNRPALIDEDR